MSSTNSSNQIQNAMSSIQNMKDSTAVMVLTFITLFIILLALLVYFLYFMPLKSKECTKMDTIYGTINGKITSIDTGGADFQYNLRDYYIKSAYNSCSGGNYKNDYVDICSLVDLIKQGVRGLDFELFSVGDQPVVATSTSDSYCIKETFNYVPFSLVMSTISDNAFRMSSAPNPFDPLIIHLRIKSSNQTMYQTLAKILEKYDSILLGKEYSYENQGKNLGATKLTDLMGKVIIIVDKSNNSFLECPEFYEYVNMTSNSIFMRALHYYDIKYTPDIKITESDRVVMITVRYETQPLTEIYMTKPKWIKRERMMYTYKKVFRK